MEAHGSSWRERISRYWSAPLVRRLLPVVAGLVALWGMWTYGAQLDQVYHVKDWLFWRIALLWLYNIILSAACTSFGFVIVSRIVRERPPVLEMMVHSMATGLVCFVLFMYVAGVFGWYHLWFAIALPALMLAVGVPFLWRYARAAVREWKERPAEPRSATSRFIVGAAIVFGVIGVALVYLPLITPDAINFDAAWYHLTVAQEYARNGHIVPFGGDYMRNMPQLSPIVHTWGWLLPVPYLTQRWTLPLHTEFSIFLWTLAGVAAMVRWLVDDDSVKGAWAAFFLFPAIFVYDNNLAGAADHFLAFFAIPLFLAAARSIRRMELGWCALAGLFAAGAALTKYQAVYLIAAGGVVFVIGWCWHAWHRIRERFRPGAAEAAEPLLSWKVLLVGPLLLAGVGIVAGSPHFIKNWVFYRDPIYPFGQGFFTHARPSTPHAAFYVKNLLEDYHWEPHGSLWKRLGDAIQIFGTFSFKPHYSFTKNWPSFGGLFTFSLPLLLFVRRPGRLWLGALAASAGVLTWTLTFRVDRNLQCVVPLLVAVTAAILIRAWQLGWAARLGIVPLVALQLIWGGDAMFYSQKPHLDSAMRLITSGYNGRQKGERFEYRKAFREINHALPPHAVLVIHNLRRTLGIDATVWEDMPGQQGIILYEGLKSPREMYDYYKKLGVTNLLHIPNTRPICSKHDDVLFNAFIHTRGVTHRRFGGYELLTLTDRPPPREPPWKVAAVGIYGYRDGLYRITQMQVYSCLPRKLQHYPRPLSPMPRDPAGVAALFGKANAVVVGARRRLTRPQQAALSHGFRQIARYRNHRIYIRRAH